VGDTRFKTLRELELYCFLNFTASSKQRVLHILKGGFLTISEKDLRSLQQNRISIIKRDISDKWDTKSTYEPFAFLFENFLNDIRKDFLTGVAYYKDAFGKQVPVENEIENLKSIAFSCGLSDSKTQMHLMRYLKLLPPTWLVDIPKWDFTDRLRTLCFSTKVLNLSQECFYQHLLAWGAGIFARANDNYKQNHVLILRGNQGIGKDFFIKVLLKGLGPYYGVWTNSRDEKEIIMLMERSLVLNIPEFDNTHQNEIAMLKGLITKYQATFRSPYARKAGTVSLRSSFVSSANCEYLLRDGTGNRRYLIFVLESFDLLEKFDEFDSSQILAQFKWAYETKFKAEPEYKLASDQYIQTQTPEPIEDEIFNFWNAEVKDYMRLTNNRQGEWLPAHSLMHIFAKIKKEFGYGRNHVGVILQNRDCKTRKTGGVFYRCNPSLYVAPSPQLGL
jgi:hypothetical protein